MSEVTGIPALNDLLRRYSGVRRVVIDGNGVAPALWVEGDHGTEDVADAAEIVQLLLSGIRASFSVDDEVALSSTGLALQSYAIDGVGQVQVAYARGAAASAVVTIDPPEIPRVSDLGFPEDMVERLIDHPRGLVIVGGESALASDLARALFVGVSQVKVDLAAAVISERPVARQISRTPMVCLRCDIRTGITRVEDASAYVGRFARMVLLDPSGENVSGVVSAALHLVDRGALVFAVAPGLGVSTILERWRVSAPQMGGDATWIATLAHLRAVLSIEQVSAIHGFEKVPEWLLADDSNVTGLLASEGTLAVGSILSDGVGGSRSREVKLADLRNRGHLSAA